MKKRLITSALPYINNIPHLGNLIQVLSADVFARFCRQRGYETLYICGADEYGTATETRALQEQIHPKELCDQFYKIHQEIYDWFAIDFDHFGRTSCPQQTEIVQQIYREIKAKGFIQKRDMEQTFCASCNRFLADRYILGHCPHCHGRNARGDQCEDCGTMLEPIELLEASCGICGNIPERRKTEHLFLNLPALKESLEKWIDKASQYGRWARNALQMTKSWIRDGLKERCITRDLSWGVAVPDMPGKVFYVWFDAPIGYISITADLLDEQGKNPQDWRNWWQNPKEVELFQFIGKDNIPFHTVLFPGSLLATEMTNSKPFENIPKETKWTMLHHMSSSEYLNYEGGKFSKTRGVGIFGNDCQDTGIPADCWRFYLYYNRPEKSDYEFTWAEFQKLLNRELIGNLGNLVNRTLSFLQRFFNGQLLVAEQVQQHSEIIAFLAELHQAQNKITEKLEWSQLKDGLHNIMSMADYGNKIFQNKEPWLLVKNDRSLAHAWLTALVYLIYDLSICLWPYLPRTCEKMAIFLGFNPSDEPSCFAWRNLCLYERLYKGKALPKPQILFQQLEDKQVAELRARFAGRQQQCKTTGQTDEKQKHQKKTEKWELWVQNVDLRVGRIVDIQPHPNAERLFVEKIDCGEAEPRTVVSGLVEYYRPEELLGKNVALVANLKPTKLRGIKSMGMLLAASPYEDQKEQALAAGYRLVEVLHPQGAPGDRIVVNGFQEIDSPIKPISIDDFFTVSLVLHNGQAQIQTQNNSESPGSPARELLVQSAAGLEPLKAQQLQYGKIS